jgi:predicted glycogen debranching enzyme
MKLPTITFYQETLKCFNEAIEKEWLLTNGMGGYSSSTVLGINTRKYHGLLVGALHPPGERTVCLSKLDEDVIVGNNVYRLGANDFHDGTYPQGYTFLKQFSIAPYPSYFYDLDRISIRKTIFMPKKKNAVSAIYEVNNKNNLGIKVRIFPLLTCRYFHNVLDHYRNPLNFSQKSDTEEIETIFKYPEASIICHSTDGEFKRKMNWVERLFYRDEAERGESSTDDCFQPGYFELQIPSMAKKEFAIMSAIDPETKIAREALDSFGNTIIKIHDTLNRELSQKNDLLDNFYRLHPTISSSDWLNWMVLAAESFIVENNGGKKSLIAGYHWFEPWGRDTFISLPGLMLTTGRFSEAKNLIQNYIEYCKNGLIPNFVSDRLGEATYNTVDATLWYVNAVLQYLKYTGDFEFVRDELWEDLVSIIEYHEQGTLFGIGLDDDGLLFHGSRLTWMDAEVEGKAITPRAGKAVEIQALWYNALRIMQLLANKFSQNSLAEKYARMADKTQESFNERFWNPKAGCLYDVLDLRGSDSSLRPNQILAVSLDYTMLDEVRSEQVVKVVNSELVTSYGLRTLASSDAKFVGKYFGNRLSRDAAYHNGTIWPWLLGPFITAFLKVNRYGSNSRGYAMKNLILPYFIQGINQAGLGTLSEVYDSDFPNKPRGCISQAWSVGEPLRAYIEDILLEKPKFKEEVLEF